MADATILLIDPSAATRTMYADYLRHHGLHVTEACDLADAIGVVVAAAPAVIVTELLIPGYDAIAGIRMFRRLEATRYARVLACATAIDPVWPYAPPGAEVDSALQKPVPPSALLTEVRYLLRAEPAMAIA